MVSEERGTVSVARDGVLRVLARPQDLAPELLAVRGAREEEARQPWWRERAGVDAVLAAAGALALWFVFVPGSALTEVTVPAAVTVTNLPDDLELESVEPAEVQVTLRGLRRELVLSEPDQVDRARRRLSRAHGAAHVRDRGRLGAPARSARRGRRAPGAREGLAAARGRRRRPAP